MNQFYITVIIATILHTAYFAHADPQTATTNMPSQAVNIMGIRDPFWPSGWRPPNCGKTNTTTEIRSPIKWREAASLLHIAGLSKKANGDYIAIITGYGIVEKGDTITVKYQGLIYTWAIKEITALGIERKRLSVTI